MLAFYWIYFSLLTFNWLGLFIKNNYFFGKNNVNWNDVIGTYFIVLDAIIYFMILTAHTFFIFEMLFVRGCLQSTSLENYKVSHIKIKKIRIWVMVVQMLDYIVYTVMLGLSLVYPESFRNNTAVNVIYTFFKLVAVVIDFALLILFILLVVFYVKTKKKIAKD